MQRVPYGWCRTYFVNVILGLYCWNIKVCLHVSKGHIEKKKSSLGIDFLLKKNTRRHVVCGSQRYSCVWENAFFWLWKLCAAFSKCLQVQMDTTAPGVFLKVCKPEKTAFYSRECMFTLCIWEWYSVGLIARRSVCVTRRKLLAYMWKLRNGL